MLKDEAKHQGLRNQLVATLINKGITDKNVLDAIKKIPRHQFLDSSFEAFAYQDKAFQIGAGQTISHPYTVAFQSQLLLLRTLQATMHPERPMQQPDGTCFLLENFEFQRSFRMT